MKMTDDMSVNCFEQKVLRSICKGIHEDGLWRRRYNSKLYDLYNQLPASKTIKTNRLRWNGHVQRLPEDNPTKIAFKTIPLGKHGMFRPKTGTYINDIERHQWLKKLGIKDWTAVARDREDWKALLKEAKADSGL